MPDAVKDYTHSCDHKYFNSSVPNDDRWHHIADLSSKKSCGIHWISLEIFKDIIKKSAWKWTFEAPFYYHGLIIIPTWISNHMPNKVWDEITYPFPKFNSSTLKFANG